MIFKFTEFHNIKLGDIIKYEKNLWKVKYINREAIMDYKNNKVNMDGSYVICVNSKKSEKRLPLYDHKLEIQPNIFISIIGYDVCPDTTPNPFAYKLWNNDNIRKGVFWKMQKQLED